MVYWQLEPFGSVVDDHRFEQLLSLQFQCNTPASTATPIFFDRRPASEIERDERLARARNPQVVADRIAAYFDARIAKQDGEGSVVTGEE